MGMNEIDVSKIVSNFKMQGVNESVFWTIK
jgi:hypothetical protein